MQELRDACAAVAARARHVRIDHEAIDGYAASLAVAGATPATDAVSAHPLPPAVPPRPAPPPPPDAGDHESLAARWLILDAINFGSGWFPTLRKPPGQSGYRTISTRLFARLDSDGPWTAPQLTRIEVRELAGVLGQDPEHELIALYAASLRDLGRRISADHDGRFVGVVDAAGGSAVALARTLGAWGCFADESRYGELRLPFLKRAQIAAADLNRAGACRFGDLDRLTMFADNLVPHVLRLDGVLELDPALVARIERGELIEHDSEAEIEIRAGAVHAVELLVAAGAGPTAADLDQRLWERGQQPRYKASPRHRTRCTAY